jgi:hypothetical protein
MWICAVLFTLGAAVAAAAIVQPRRLGRPWSAASVPHHPSGPPDQRKDTP